MTVKDLLQIPYVSVDVCDDYDERCYIAYESGYELTDAGVIEFADAFNVPITGIDGYALTLHCINSKEAQACADLFNSLAGYCGADDFDKWFKER